MPYHSCPGKSLLKVTEWTFYTGQYEVVENAPHQSWTQDLRKLGRIRLPAGAEFSFYQQRAKPKATTYQGRILRQKMWAEISDVMWKSRGACGYPLSHGADLCGDRKGLQLGDAVEGMP